MISVGICLYLYIVCVVSLSVGLPSFSHRFRSFFSATPFRPCARIPLAASPPGLTPKKKHYCQKKATHRSGRNRFVIRPQPQPPETTSTLPKFVRSVYYIGPQIANIGIIIIIISVFIIMVDGPRRSTAEIEPTTSALPLLAATKNHKKKIMLSMQ